MEHATELAGANTADSGHSGHRAATWMLTFTSLVVLFVTAAVWALVAGASTLLFSMATAVISILLLMARGQFRVGMMADTASRLAPVTASVATSGVLALALVAIGPGDDPSALNVAGFLGALTLAAMVAHLLGTKSLRVLWRRGHLRAKALVYGTDALAREVAIEIGLRPDYGIDIVGFVSPTPPSNIEFSAPVFDTSIDLAEAATRTGAERLIIGPGTAMTDRLAMRLARRAAALGMPVFVVPRFFEMGLGMDTFAPDRARGYPLVRLQRAAHPQISIRMKRAFDYSVAATVLLLTLPISLIVAVLIKLTSPGPVVFSQTRVGQDNQPIVIRKFRSMRMSDGSDHEWTAEQRVTWIGRWIRRLNIDELPQLYSVLSGDMSLVGPRPERPVFVETFSTQFPDYDERHRMPVGITGLAQIIGLRGDTSIAERIKYDNLYIDQWSFGLDIRILIKTAFAIIHQAAYTSQAVELEHALEASEGDSYDIDLRPGAQRLAPAQPIDQEIS